MLEAFGSGQVASEWALPGEFDVEFHPMFVVAGCYHIPSPFLFSGMSAYSHSSTSIL